MKILLTGASSFTGFWFARELARRGNEVVCPLTKPSHTDYAGVRRERAELLARERGVRLVFDAATRSGALAELAARERFDVFCNHAFATLNHKDPAYSATRALEIAVEGLDALMSALREHGCAACVHSGSYFELGESVRSERGFFSPYALAKNLSWDYVRYWANRLEMQLGKFVIPNPVGAFEERGLTTYLAREWLAGRVPVMQTPHHVRDNAPVNALAARYADFVERVAETGTLAEPLFARPSGFVMRNDAWVKFFGEKLFGACPDFACVSPEESAKWGGGINHEPELCRGVERADALDALEAFWRELREFYVAHYATAESPLCGMKEARDEQDTDHGRNGVRRASSVAGAGEDSGNAHTRGEPRRRKSAGNVS